MPAEVLEFSSRLGQDWRLGLKPSRNAMNYRHIYHAGNFADVVKHAILALVLAHLKGKEAPFFVLDSHAGLGAYDLAAEEAARTGEWRDGIGRLMAAPEPIAELSDYLAAVRGLNPDGRLRWYPGSPALAAGLSRPQDRLALVELHPEDHRALKRRFAGDSRIGIHGGDGYRALKALLPPPERRGVVLIDPPYESADEIARLRKGLAEALARWRSGIFLLWYPIKRQAAAERFLADLAMLGPPPVLVAEITLPPGIEEGRLAGSGLAIVNPPWKLDSTLASVLPRLGAILAPGGGYRLDWLVPETTT